MKIITQRDLVRAVADRFEQTYGEGWHPFVYLKDNPPRKWQEIAADLRVLDLETCPASAVNSIMTNEAWTTLTCNECGKVVTEVVEIGEEPNPESRTANVCFRCIDAAWLMTQLTNKVQP